MIHYENNNSTICFSTVFKCMYLFGFAQEMEVSGTVYDAQDKSPIIGATVTLREQIMVR